MKSLVSVSLTAFLAWSAVQSLSVAQTPEPSPESSPAASSANPAVVAVPRVPWLDNHEQLVATAKKVKPNLVFLGDSITAGWSQKGSGIWRERYAPYGAVNLGIPGDATQHVLWRIQNGELGGDIQPKLIVLMIGTNNGGTAEQVAAGVGAIIAKIQELCPQTKILLLDVFPRSEKPDHYSRKRNDALNVIISKFGDDQKVFFLPIGNQFLEPDGTLSAEVMPDFLHPSGKGYQIWANAIDAKLKELMQ